MLGSHNSMSYLPIKGWRKILTPWTKCQSLNIEEQYAQGVRYFDLRVRRYKNKGWWYCHNKAIFTPVMESKEILEFLIEKKAPIRIILDVRETPENTEDYKKDFLELVDWMKDNGLQVDSVKVYWEWKEYGEYKIKQYEYHASVSAPWYLYLLGTEWFAKWRNHDVYSLAPMIMDDSVELLDYIQYK